ncbi:lipid-A-disaccharide synthase [Parvularcula oceani]|uniref:lipid-A-disaccharide synthase n=1 Tax=Parvularcula oceani TaxID=1247963 RepID=UPI000A58CB96|nr:lipid-A-disaccharide synthase [Parvularcula oceani]
MAEQSRAPTLLLSAVEPSADAIGAELLEALRARLPGARFVGCGGAAMAAAGFSSAFDTAPLCVMGLGDALRAVPQAKRRAAELARLARSEGADAAVLIDAWGFSRLTAQALGRTSPATKRVKLAAPQVWASRPGRTRAVRDLFDLVLALLPFEPPLFEAEGTRAVFVGNPNFEAVSRTPRSGPAFRARHGLDGAPLLAVLPGSRKGEASRLLDIFADASDASARDVPGLRPVIVAAPAVEALVRDHARNWARPPLVVGPEERFDAFDAADAAIAASGTVTTELAMCGTPMVVAYKVGALTEAWAKRVLITDTVTILNVAAGERVIPERLQDSCTPEQLTADIVRLFTDDAARRRQLSMFRRVLPQLLGPGRAADRAAGEIAALLQGEDRLHLDAGAERQ